MRKGGGARYQPWVVLLGVVLVVLVGKSSAGVLAGTPSETAIRMSETILDVIDVHGRAEEVQNIVNRQVFSNENLDGNVQAASIAASLEALIRPKREALEQMRDCIEAFDATAPFSGQARGTILNPFSDPGYYPADRWAFTKTENEQQAACLRDLWPDIAENNTNIRLQHFAGVSGYVEGTFRDTAENDGTDLFDDRIDARRMPHFVFSTTQQKDVMIILDTNRYSREWLEVMRTAAKNVIDGLTDRDYAQVYTTRSESANGLNCGGNRLLRMTEENKAQLRDFVDLIEPDGQTDLQTVFDSAFDQLLDAQESDSNRNSDCQPVVLLMTPSFLETSLVVSVSDRNDNFGARIFVFSLDAATHPEGYIGGGNAYQLACRNEGVWYNVEDPTQLEHKALEYQIVIAASREITDPTYTVNWPAYGAKEGLYIVGSLPVYRRDSVSGRTTLIGVVAVEFDFSEIQEFLDFLARGVSFAFLTTTQGDMLLHPSYRSPTVVVQLPLMYDSALIESSENFRNEVRGPLVRDPSGEVDILVDRPLQKGDIGTEGFTTRPTQTTFFWSRLTEIPFIVVLAYSDAELRSPAFYANTDSGFVISSVTHPIFLDPDFGADGVDYLPSDFVPGLIFFGDLNIFSFDYSVITDNLRSYTRKYQEEVLKPCIGEDGLYDLSCPRFSVANAKAMQTYANNLRSPYNENPGMLQQVKELSRVATQIAEEWKEDYLDLQAGDGDFLSLRYLGFYTNTLQTFPGLVRHILTRIPTFFARGRPWYQKAEASPSGAALSPPYQDGADLAAKVFTISRAIFSDQSREESDREVLAVVGADMPYATFHQLIVDSTGCAFNRSDVTPTTPMCYLLDNSGLLIFTPEFLSPTFSTIALTASDSLPLPLEEPQLTQQLLDLGVLRQSVFTNFRGSYTFTFENDEGVTLSSSTPIDDVQELTVLSVDDDAFEGGNNPSGTLTKTDGFCSAGQWTMVRVAETNVYLIQIENYSRDESSSCEELNLPPLINITIDTCAQNAEDYPRANDLCPNSDRRDSFTESNRPDDALCDLEPPKEVDYTAWDDPEAIAMVIITCLLIIFTLVLLCAVIKYRNTPVILLASPTFVYLQFAGMILGYSCIFLWTGEPTDVQCGLRPWIASIAFVLLVGPMFAKTYRIWRLFSNKGFFAPKISDIQVLAYVGAMMVFPLILCIVWCAVAIPEPNIKDDAFDDDKVVKRCEGDYSRIFEGILIGYCGILLLVGSFFAFRARKAHSHFNESRFVAISIYSLSFCGIVGVVLTYVLLGLPIAYYLIFCVTVIVGILTVTIVIYWPKLRIAIFRPERNVYTRQSSSRATGGASTTGADISD
eukprot:CAMPEP_0119121066 /NCGR_PEP_ID=MMETSP1310-20130426/1857_1 /TAXON_ID=464262 /ORGANISM="Genus nov. species nov., Strain RCC2339" /LENGTH=1337 /DNA_ID=CAMNT_0007110603 /DNA_START=126 /DNA_END=4139 /DNA_ORIENTATION=-